MLCRNSLRLLSSVQQATSSVNKASLLRGQRYLSVSSKLNDSFKIQDTDDFKEKVLDSNVPVIIDFFATWCNPCRVLTPRIESVVGEKAGKINLAKVDIDELTDLALEYQVSSVPVLLAMKNGKELERIVGLQDADKLRAFVNRLSP